MNIIINVLAETFVEKYFELFKCLFSFKSELFTFSEHLTIRKILCQTFTME